MSRSKKLFLAVILFFSSAVMASGSDPEQPMSTVVLTTPLHLAVSACDIAEVNQILESGGFSRDVRDMAMDSPLHTAIKAKCYRAIVPLLNNGFTPSAMDIEQRLPMNIGLEKLLLSTQFQSLEALAAYKILFIKTPEELFFQGDMKGRSTVSILQFVQAEISKRPSLEQLIPGKHLWLLLDLPGGTFEIPDGGGRGFQ